MSINWWLTPLAPVPTRRGKREVVERQEMWRGQDFVRLCWFPIGKSDGGGGGVGWLSVFYRIACGHVVDIYKLCPGTTGVTVTKSVYSRDGVYLIFKIRKPSVFCSFYSTSLWEPAFPSLCGTAPGAITVRIQRRGAKGWAWGRRVKGLKSKKSEKDFKKDRLVICTGCRFTIGL
jgi:hypothetical protein